jgi:hypothetical protein
LSPAAAGLAPSSTAEITPTGGVRIVWGFPGHGSARLICGKVTKVGHRKASGRWCLWDELYRCRSHECPECFDQPGGYACSEAKSIADRLEKYFELRNLALIRGWERRRAHRFDQAAFSVDREARREVARTVRWLRVEAGRARGRARVRKPVHVVVAPPPELWDRVDTPGGYRELRSEAYEQARERGVDGACAVFHHKRLRSSRWDGNASLFEPDELDIPADGPHWHMIGDGWVLPRGPLHERANEVAHDFLGEARHLLAAVRLVERVVGTTFRPTAARLSGDLRYALPSLRYHSDETERARVEARAEWFVSNLGVRVSVFQTALYVLTHAGFARKMSRVETSYPRARAPVETVTWWGSCSARAFPALSAPLEPVVCLRCGELLGGRDVIPVRYLGSGPPMAGDLDGEPEEWRAEGLKVAVSRVETSMRLARRLNSGTWRFRKPRGLERWEVESANNAADVEWALHLDYLASHEDHGARARRLPVRDNFNHAWDEERECDGSERASLSGG